MVLYTFVTKRCNNKPTWLNKSVCLSVSRQVITLEDSK
jgi:hypothetical protein